MPPIVRFPIISPVQFSQRGRTQNPVYNRRLLNAGWSHAETLAPETGRESDQTFCTQKFCLSDTICIQVHFNAYFSPVLYLYKGTPDGSGKLMGYTGLGVPVGTVQQVVVPGNYYPNGTDPNRIFMYTICYTFRPLQINGNLDEGIYYLVLRVDNNEGEDAIAYYHSEPLELKESHPKTMLLRYKNSVNTLDGQAIFEQVNTAFGLRVEGDLHSYEPGSVDTAFNDQNEETRILYSVPYDTFKFSVRNQPDYAIQKLSRVFACDSVFIDELRVSKAEGEGFEFTTIDALNPLTGATITVRPYENEQSMTNIKRSFTVFEGVSAPYAVSNVTITDGHIEQELNEYSIIEDAVAGEDLAAAWNAANSGLSGFFTYEDNNMTYTNAPGERWKALRAWVHDNIMTVEVTASLSNRQFKFSQQGSPMVVDWNDGAANYYADTNTTIQNLSHTYAATGTYVMRVFYQTDNGFYRFTISPQQTGMRVTNIGGLAPSNLQYWYVFDADLDSSFNLDFLIPARASLLSLQMVSCGISHPFTGTFLTGGGTNILQKLTFIDLRDNDISQIGIDQFLIYYKAYTAWMLRHCYVRLELNSAPSSVGLSIKNDINNIAQRTLITTD